MQCPIKLLKKKPKLELTEYEAIEIALQTKRPELLKRKVRSGDSIRIHWNITIE